MSTTLEEVKAAVERGVADGTFDQSEIDRQTRVFRDRFGPDALSRVDGVALLRLMHGRREDEERCLMYWLEFKNDEEFAGRQFGGVGGGSALKFTVYNKEPAGLWLTGSPKSQKSIPVDEAASIARGQCDELIAGCRVLESFDAAETSDERSTRLDREMRAAAPTLHSASWAHKYWQLCFPDRIDTFHSPQYQRFHLLKLLQMPPDEQGVLAPDASRFVCAGRFVELARQAGTSPTILCRALVNLNPHHGYWKVGTTSATTGQSQWPVMRDGSFVSIGWKNSVPDLSGLLKEKDLKERIADMLRGEYNEGGVAKRKAGEIEAFVSKVGEGDIALACDGGTVLGIGKVTGAYEYKPDLVFPHTRAVRWVALEPWQQSPIEGPRTTVYGFGRSAANILNVEKRIVQGLPSVGDAGAAVAPEAAKPSVLPELDEWSIRVDAALRRKGQVILYGPPGTGKTYRAVRLAQELAARQAFRKVFAELNEAERTAVVGERGLVRVCTFHPNWGYEDFLEGVRPATQNGVIAFNERDGLFKTLCDDAARAECLHQSHFLVIDEINRGDIPRIFGELLTVIELDKREQSIALPVTGRALRVPRNVFLIGTMNTADRSISLLDAALRRRFSFIELMPDSSCLAGKTVDGLALGPWLDALNARLRKHLRRDARNLQVGHAYLMPSTPITSFVEFARVLRDDIIPLLEEYCYDDFGTLQKILGAEVVDADAGRIREELFQPARQEDLRQAVLYEEIETFSLDEVGGTDDEEAAEADA